MELVKNQKASVFTAQLRWAVSVGAAGHSILIRARKSAQKVRKTEMNLELAPPRPCSNTLSLSIPRLSLNSLRPPPWARYSQTGVGATSKGGRLSQTALKPTTPLVTFAPKKGPRQVKQANFQDGAKLGQAGSGLTAGLRRWGGRSGRHKQQGMVGAPRPPPRPSRR